MKTISINFLLVLLIFNLTGCKKENNVSSFSEFKYADKPQTINCSSADSKLLNEAIYTFENDIANFYDAKQKNVIRGYNAFIRKAASNKKVAFEEFVSQQSVNIAKVLNDTGIFKNGGLDYNNDLIACIGENMAEGDLKTTFNALLSTNSMSKTLFGPALNGKASSIEKDKYLGLYIALEYFYSEINTIDFSQMDFEKRDAEQIEKAKPINSINPKNPKVDFNKRPRKQ